MTWILECTSTYPFRGLPELVIMAPVQLDFDQYQSTVISSTHAAERTVHNILELHVGQCQLLRRFTESTFYKLVVYL